jgi:hypothetical protein
MVSVKYPIPYALSAVYGPSRKPNTIRISDEVVLDVRNASEDEAPIVMKCRTAWPTSNLPGQEGDDDGYRHLINPQAEFRFFDGAFYAPLMIFKKTRCEPAEFAEPADFERLETDTHLWATPFSTPYASQVFGKNLLIDHDNGLLPSLAQAKLREIHSKNDPRELALEAAKSDLANCLIVDNRAYRRLAEEPVLRYRVSSGRATVTLEEKVDPFRLRYDNSGYFRTDRFDDCIDHLSATYPEAEIFLNVDKITFDPDIQLKFDDEALSMVVLATDLDDKLRFHGDCGPELEGLKTKLSAYGDLPFSQQLAKAEDISGVVERILDLAGPDLDLPAEMYSDLRRWNLRPVEAGSSASPGI